MGIVGEQSMAGCGMGRIDDPEVASGGRRGSLEGRPQDRHRSDLPRISLQEFRRYPPGRSGYPCSGDPGSHRRLPRRDRHGRFEWGTPVEILREKCLSVEALVHARLDEGIMSLGQPDIEQIEGKPEGDAVRDGHRVETRPWLDIGQFEALVFGRQLDTGFPNIGVDTARISIEECPGLLRIDLPGAFGGPAQTERPELDVRVQSGLADQFGQCAREQAAIVVHLEETVSGVEITHCEIGVVIVVGIDMGRLRVVPDNPDRRQEVGKIAGPKAGDRAWGGRKSHDRQGEEGQQDFHLPERISSRHPVSFPMAQHPFRFAQHGFALHPF